MIFNHDDTDSKYPDPGATTEHLCGSCFGDLGSRVHQIEGDEGEINVCEKCKCLYESWLSEKQMKEQMDSGYFDA